MLIPAHLDGTEASILVTLDGPSLRIRRPGEAETRLPLARLARITVRGSVSFAAETLPACLRAGVPVCFLDGEGRTIGQLLPVHRRREDLAALVDEAVASGVFASVRESWRAAAHRAACIRLTLALPIRVPDLRTRTVARAAARLVDLAGAPIATDELVGRLEGLLAALVAELLLHEGAGARFQGGDPDLDLAADFRGVLGLELWPVAWRLARYLAAHANKHRRDQELQARIVRAFEAHKPRLEKVFAETAGLLRRCLREALS
ncbi:MAG: CRISPR-associated endonuclease Cas1 [Geminicoccaceae bacterium]|nr:CRISPR-associated endonuclease Cas1 [Geminicoccaceae bacterium]